MLVSTASVLGTRVSGTARRASTVLVTLLGLLALTFFIGRVMPLDPVLADLPRIPMPAPQQHRPPTPALPATRSIRKQAVTGILAVGGVGAVVGLWTMMTLSIVLGTGIFAAAAGAMIATAILTLVVSGEERPKS